MKQASLEANKVFMTQRGVFMSPDHLFRTADSAILECKLSCIEQSMSKVLQSSGAQEGVESDDIATQFSSM